MGFASNSSVIIYLNEIRAFNSMHPFTHSYIPIRFVCDTDAVDLLEAVGISQLPLGVVNTTGICDQRAVAVNDGVPVYGRPDQAYRLTQRAVLTVSTAQVFQGKRCHTHTTNTKFLMNNV